MNKDRQTNAEVARLRREFVHRLIRPFTQFLSIEAPAVAVILLSNSPWAHFFECLGNSVGLECSGIDKEAKLHFGKLTMRRKIVCEHDYPTRV